MVSGIRGPARRLLFLLLATALVVPACGKKGPPLAPLLKVPVAPPDAAARRSGDVANLQVRIPAANSDNTRPADIVRVEVYGFTGAPPEPRDLLKYGTLVATVPVRKPAEEEEESPRRKGERGTKREEKAKAGPAAASRPPASFENGFDQGNVVVVSEALGPAQMKVVEPPRPRGSKAPAAAAGVDAWQPPLQPEAGKGDRRLYFVVGVNHKGQRGAFSPALAVPLAAPPSPPSNARIAYDEKGVTLSWDGPADLPRAIQAPTDEGALPSTPRTLQARTGGYNVYETGPAAPSPAGLPVAVAGTLAAPLNDKPLQEPTFTASGLEFGKERCFVVRAVAQAGTQVVESAPTAPLCVTPRDTFPPAAPKALSAVGSEGAISLIWEANTEADLAGYLVLRAEPGGTPQPLTPAPIKETTYRDATAARGVRYVYTVVAVDAAGNRSAPSASVEETAR